MAVDPTQTPNPQQPIQLPVQQPAPQPAQEKVTTTTQSSATTTTGGYGQLIGLVVQVAELVLIGYLVVAAIGYGNHLAETWVTPVVAVIFAHNSLSPSQWGGGPPNS